MTDTSMSHSATLANGERVYLSDTPPQQTNVCSDYGLCIVTLGDERYVCGYVRFDQFGERSYYPVPIYGIRAGNDGACILGVRTEPYMQFASPREVQVSPRNDPLGILDLIQKGNVLESILYLTMTDDERSSARAKKLAEQRSFGILRGVLLGLINMGEVHMEDINISITPQLAGALSNILRARFALNSPYDHGTVRGVDILDEHLDGLLATASPDAVEITPAALVDILEALIPIIRSNMAD